MGKYIFIVGAPGSKFSSIARYIENSADIDGSDRVEARQYKHHDVNGEFLVLHSGAYFDPGMEYGNNFDELSSLTKEQAESEFDRPFSGTGVKIVKGHMMCNHIKYLKDNWPDCPVVLVHRDNDACLGWWVRCGEFGIKYPNYSWYQNLQVMKEHVNEQNDNVGKYLTRSKMVGDNKELCKVLGIASPEEYQNYFEHDIRVGVL